MVKQFILKKANRDIVGKKKSMEDSADKQLS